MRDKMSIISKAILGISIGLVAVIFSAIGLTACNNQTTDIQLIGEEKAKEIVLVHAGVTADEITRYTLHRDRDDGKDVYEIEFWRGNIEYDYEIDAKTGEILQFDKDAERY